MVSVGSREAHWEPCASVSTAWSQLPYGRPPPTQQTSRSKDQSRKVWERRDSREDKGSDANRNHLGDTCQNASHQPAQQKHPQRSENLNYTSQNASLPVASTEARAKLREPGLHFPEISTSARRSACVFLEQLNYTSGSG